jgi:hypothetical protein
MFAFDSEPWHMMPRGPSTPTDKVHRFGSPADAAGSPAVQNCFSSRSM